MNWLTNDLKIEIRELFQPFYGEKLSDKDITDIALNIMGVVELFAKYEFQKNEKT